MIEPSHTINLLSTCLNLLNPLKHDLHFKAVKNHFGIKPQNKKSSSHELLNELDPKEHNRHRGSMKRHTNTL